MNLTNSSAAPWNDIVVTNNDNNDRTPWAGTVSVLQPTPPPSGTVITGKLMQSVNVSVPNTSLINDLTVTIAINDTQAAVSNLSVVLIAPNNAGQITLVANQINAAGQTNPGQGLPSGSGIGVYNGVTIGTIFDDNATRDIFDATPTGTNGNTAAGTNYVGFFRPESGFISLSSFVQSLGTKINGTWTLFIQNYSTAKTGFTSLNDFSLQFSTGLTQPSFPTVAVNQFDYVYKTNTSAFLTDVLGGSLTDTYGDTPAPSTPQGIGPGMVMAVDNTLGPFSPFGADVGGTSGRTFGRIYMSFVGYFVVTVNGVTNPRTNTDIFLIFSDDGGMSWSAPELVNDDQGTSDGESGANDSLTPNANNIVTGRSQFQPEIAVDQSTGTLVMSWASMQTTPSVRSRCNLHHHQHRRRPDLRTADLRQPAQTGRRRDHWRRQQHRPGVGRRVGRQRADGTPRSATATRWDSRSPMVRSSRSGPATSTIPITRRPSTSTIAITTARPSSLSRSTSGTSR